MSPLFGPFPTRNVTCKCAFKRSIHRPEQRHIVDRKGCKKSSPPFSSHPYLDLFHRSPQASSVFATEAGSRLRRDPRCLKLASSQTAQATNMQSAEDTAYISRTNEQQIKRCKYTLRKSLDSLESSDRPCPSPCYQLHWIGWRQQAGRKKNFCARAWTARTCPAQASRSTEPLTKALYDVVMAITGCPQTHFTQSFFSACHRTRPGGLSNNSLSKNLTDARLTQQFPEICTSDVKVAKL
jgi:hypothetical protein